MGATLSSPLSVKWGKDHPAGNIRFPNEPALKPTESGRSWIVPIYKLTKPITSLFVYTATQWSALKGAIPTAYNSIQIGGTVHHELGHQMDRIWAQRLGYSSLNKVPAAVVLNGTNKNYGKAVNVDGKRLTSQDINDLQKFYPKFLTPSGALSFNEIFAEQFAINNGGGATGVSGAEDYFLRTRFPCSLWYVTTMHTGTLRSGTAAPVAPSAPGRKICFMPGPNSSFYTSWEQISSPY